MRFHCTACGLLVRASGFRVEGARLVLACERCGTEAPVQVGGELRADAGGRAVAQASTRAEVPGEDSPRQEAREAPREPGPEIEDAPGASNASSAGEPAESPQLRVLRGGGLGPAAARPSAAQRAASASIPSVPEGHCPRCLAPRSPAARGCAGCGLDFLRVRAESLAPSTRLATAWNALQEAWEDSAAHQDFVRRAVAAGELSGAGRLYRLHLLHRPGDAHAQRALERMRQQALATWLTPKAAAVGEPRSPRGLRWLLLLLLVLVGAMVTAAVWARFPAPPTP